MDREVPVDLSESIHRHVETTEWILSFGQFSTYKEIAWVNLTGSVVRNGLGELRYFLALIEDITAIKKTEQEKEDLRSQLSQSQKMEALGTLVGGIAHDFNNMLQSIMGYSEMLLIGKEKGEQGYRELQTIIETGPVIYSQIKI